MKIYYPNLPEDLQPPFNFGEPEGNIEGAVDNIWEIIQLFEPVDVLNGVIESVDANDKISYVMTEDQGMLERNQYGDPHKVRQLKIYWPKVLQNFAFGTLPKE